MSRHPVAAVALLAVLTLGLSACGRDEASSLAEAKARIDKRDPAAAEIELKNVIQKFPKSGEARYLLGLQLLERGDAATALIELERARDLGFDRNQLLPALARALVASNKTQRVIDELAGQTLNDPLAQATLRVTVASAYAREGKLDKAGELVEQALKDAPDAEVALLAQAKVTGVRGNPAAAMASIDTLLAKHPNSHEGWSLKGDLLLRQPDGQPAAIAAYRKALEALPSQVHARAALVAIQLSRGDMPAAQKDLDELRKAAPRHFSTSFLDAQMAAAKRDHERARTIYQAMLKQAPDHPLLLVSAAENELRLNSLGQAEVMASKALTMSPNDVSARRVLAQTLIRRGLPAKAAVTLGPVVDRPDAPADVLALAAQAQLMNGNPKEADALFARLAKLNPSDPRLRTIIATASLARGANTDAVIGQLQTISADDAGISADMAILSTRMRERQWDGALKAIEPIQRKQPDKALPLQLKAQVLAQKKDFAGARQALNDALTKEPDYLPAIMALATLDMSEGKPDVAKQRFKALLERQPNNAPALLALAELSQRGQAPASEVQGYLEAAIKANPQEPLARVALIEHHGNRGDWRAALSAANAAVVALPDSTDMVERLARIQLRMGEPDQALSSYGKITTMQPKSAVGHLGQAQVHLAAGNLVQAQRSLDRVFEREPEHVDARIVQVAVMLGRREYKNALESARKVQAARPNDATGWQLEADVESAQAHWDVAAAALRQAVNKAAPGMAPVKLHYALLKGGKPAEAEAFANDWIKRHPKDAQLMFYLGDSAHASGNAELAERRYRELLAVNPDHPLALNNLAMLLLQQKKPGALALIDKAVLQLPQEPALLDTQAAARAAAGQMDQAIEVQTQVVSLAPKVAMFRLHLARLQLQAGKRSEAKAELARLADAGLTMSEAQRAEMRELLASLSR